MQRGVGFLPAELTTQVWEPQVFDLIWSDLVQRIWKGSNCNNVLTNETIEYTDDDCDHYGSLWPAVTLCDHLKKRQNCQTTFLFYESTYVIYCDWLWPRLYVTRCYQCDQMWPMWPDVTNVTRCYKCYNTKISLTIRPHVATCDHVTCDQMLPMLPYVTKPIWTICDHM